MILFSVVGGIMIAETSNFFELCMAFDGAFAIDKMRL